MCATSDVERMAHGFVVSLGEHAQPIPRTRAIWARERTAQIDAMDHGEPAPPMTAPPPFSPAERYDPRNR